MGTECPPYELKIENELDDLLLPYKIDLSVIATIDNAELLDHIRRVGLLFYQRSHSNEAATNPTLPRQVHNLK